MSAIFIKKCPSCRTRVRIANPRLATQCPECCTILDSEIVGGRKGYEGEIGDLVDQGIKIWGD